MNQYLNVKIISPKADLYNDQAYSVSSANSLGNFDVLPLHANFITLLKNAKVTIVDKDKKKFEFSFAVAILEAMENKVVIYTDLSLSNSK
jgi:F0F1-type ATP synthase epsilon subunit